jgi:hypothetical protein
MAQVAHRRPVAMRSAARWRHYAFSPELDTKLYGAASSRRFLPMGPAGCEELTKGGLWPTGSSGAGCAAARLKL